MATTSYQEAPYYSDSYDSYLTNNANNLSASNRLLVMGCQAENPLNNGQYVLFGDDNSPITAINSSLAGYITMQRKWLVNANTTSNNWVELSYFDSLATGFANHKTDTYLIIDRSGTGNFTNMEYLLGNGTDVTRSKILFSNIIWSGKDVFTFGYKKPNLVKRDPNSNDPESTDEKSSLLIYYKDMRDISMVTVKLKLIKPSASTVLMYDMMGRLIYKTDLPSSAEVQLLDIKLPTTGVYIVKAITPKGELSAKVISKIGR